MKGSFFQKPLEFKLFINGESWNQGDSITGTLAVKNHGSEEVSLSDIQLHFAYGLYKHVKAKSADAFKILDSAPIGQSQTIGAGQFGEELKWKIQLKKDCTITDKTGSIYVLYGCGLKDCKDALAMGQLQITVLPNPLFLEYVEVFNLNFNFIEKFKKAKADFVEVKLAPPSGKTHASIEHLMLHFRMNEEVLEVKYTFNVKKIDASTSTMKLKKEKKSYQQSFAPEEYLQSNKKLNRDFIAKSITDIIEQLKSIEY